MVEEGAVLVQRKLVNEPFTGHHRRLSNAGNAIHLNREFETVPVYPGGLWQMIFKDDADAIAFICLDGRPRRAAVKAPEIEGPPGNDHLFYRLCDQMEDLDAVVHRELQIGNVRRTV